MIVYLDTSALVPLLINEPVSPICEHLWDDADEPLMHRTGALADLHSLRGYDATHCAGAESINESDVVAASGDRQLLAAWRALGMHTLDVSDDRRNA